LTTRARASEHAVVRLYEKCQEVLGDLPDGTPATEDDVNAIAPFMDVVTPADLGIIVPTRASNHLGRALGRAPPAHARYPPLEYLKLHDSPAFTLGVFCFPENGKIPLHDHPGMTVVSKLVYGRLRVRSFDWADANETGKEINPKTGVATFVPRKAVVVADRELGQTPTPPLALYPRDANVHTFTALAPSAMMDLLTPPYAVGNGRDCHYFVEVDAPAERGAPRPNEAWLLESECPESFVVNAGLYAGPKLRSESRE